MLAQNFKTAADLGMTDIEYESLVKVLGMLERGDITPKEFYMGQFRNECSTVGCICGWCFFVSHGAAFPEVGNERFERMSPLSKRLPDELQELFDMKGHMWGSSYGVHPPEAALAVRNYLTTGEARWREVLRSA